MATGLCKDHAAFFLLHNVVDCIFIFLNLLANEDPHQAKTKIKREEMLKYKM